MEAQSRRKVEVRDGVAAYNREGFVRRKVIRASAYSARRSKRLGFYAVGKVYAKMRTVAEPFGNLLRQSAKRGAYIGKPVARKKLYTVLHNGLAQNAGKRLGLARAYRPKPRTLAPRKQYRLHTYTPVVS
jgi:hypothetical protein